MGDYMDYSQRKNLNLGDLISEPWLKLSGLQAWSACYMFKAADEQWVASAAGGDECGMSFSRHKRASWPTTLFRYASAARIPGVARSPPTTEETLQILEEHGGGLGWLTSGAGLNN